MQRLLQAENLQKAFTLETLDISDRRPPTNIGKFDLFNVWLALKHMAECAVLIVRRSPAIVYLNISQGVWGYLRDLGFILPALVMRRRVVLHLRGSEFQSFYSSMPKLGRLFTRLVFRRVSRVVVLGQSLKRIFESLVEPNRVSVVPNGIDYRNFEEKREAAGKIRMRILYLSSLQRRKGVLEVIRALPEIIAHQQGVSITFVGEWQNEDEKREALRLIDAKELNRYVTFAGEVSGSAKIRLYQEHDIFLFTPIQPEGLPWVILEAMSASLPVITSNQGAIAEVVEDGKTGFIIEPRPTAIAKTVCDLLDNPAKARAMGRSGRSRIEQCFSEDRYFKRIEQVFMEALST